MHVDLVVKNIFEVNNKNQNAWLPNWEKKLGQSEVQV